MTPKGRCFPYEKSVVLNALYDAIEKLGLSLDSANSVRGTLIVSDPEHTGRMRIALGFGMEKDQTTVEFYPENADTGFTERWSPVIIDELAGNMRRVYPTEKGRS